MKYILYFGGLLIFTSGIGLTIQSDFGASPYDAMLVGFHHTLGLTVGSWEIIVSLFLIFCNALMEKERPNFLGLITAFITGLFIDFWLFVFQWIEPTSWYAMIICFALGIIVTELGISIYLLARMAIMPFDQTMLIITKLTGKSYFFSKTLIYTIFFITAFLLNGPIGIGTIIIVCFSGLILNTFVVIIDKYFVHKKDDKKIQNLNS